MMRTFEILTTAFILVVIVISETDAVTNTRKFEEKGGK